MNDLCNNVHIEKKIRTKYQQMSMVKNGYIQTI